MRTPYPQKIIHIVNRGSSFRPTRPIHPDATAIHSLEINADGNLQRDGEVIDTRNPKRGLQEFLDWLNDRKREAIEVQ